jgi:hypothetical protein
MRPVSCICRVYPLHGGFGSCLHKCRGKIYLGMHIETVFCVCVCVCVCVSKKACIECMEAPSSACTNAAGSLHILYSRACASVIRAYACFVHSIHAIHDGLVRCLMSRLRAIRWSHTLSRCILISISILFFYSDCDSADNWHGVIR